jgi:putative colanic acid biosysnthesis UDP-glucose lipid carrier transferase
MRNDRSYQRTFSNAPESATSMVAAFLEPAVIVMVYLSVLVSFNEPIVRADLTLCLLVFAITFPGRNRFKESLLAASVDVVSTWLGLLAILLLCGYATSSLGFFDGRVLMWWAILTPVAQWIPIAVGHHIIRRHAALPENRRTAVVIGAAAVGVKVARALREAHDQGIDFVGYFDDRADDRVDPNAAAHRIGSLKDAAQFVRAHAIREVYITLALGSQPRIVELLEDLQGTTASIYFVPDVFGITIIQGRLEDLNGVPIVGMCETPFTGINQVVKRLEDIVLSSVILILIAPVLLAIAIGVKLSSPGPAIFRQKRNGLVGEEITVYKFRSMRAMDNGPVVKQATKDDPRITPFGAFLRKTSLDELPQFFNVLQGRMSIVGPRPHAVAHNELYRKLIKAYMVRHKVKPGITGWAQVNGHRGETDTVDKMQARVEYDLEYLRNWSLGFDLQIIARTIKLVFFDRNAY